MSDYEEQIRELKKRVNNINVRKAQVLFRNKWKDVDGKDIKKGMLFRLFEPDGSQVGGEGVCYIASGDSFLREDGVLCTPSNFSIIK